jgi:hypothetical protein
LLTNVSVEEFNIYDFVLLQGLGVADFNAGLFKLCEIRFQKEILHPENL